MRPGLLDSGEISPAAASAAGERGAVAFCQLAARDGHDGLPSPEARKAVRPGRFGQEQSSGAGRVADADQSGPLAQFQLVEDGQDVGGEPAPDVGAVRRTSRGAVASHVEGYGPEAIAQCLGHRCPAAPVQAGPVQHQDRSPVAAKVPAGQARPVLGRCVEELHRQLLRSHEVEQAGGIVHRIGAPAVVHDQVHF